MNLSDYLSEDLPPEPSPCPIHGYTIFWRPFDVVPFACYECDPPIEKDELYQPTVREWMVPVFESDGTTFCRWHYGSRELQVQEKILQETAQG